MPTSADFAAIAALGGGWIATTLEDFTAQRLAAESAAVAQAVRDWFTAQKFVVEEQIQSGTITTRAEVAALISGAV